MKTPHVIKALKYARDVVSGKIVACKWVKLACQRHFDDANKALRKDYPFRFDAGLAEWACALAEQFPHIKGHWAIPQAGVAPRIHLEPFQCFERAMLFGWVEKGSKLRRFQKGYIERPRKNAKSTDAAITGLTCFAADGEFGAEVYSGATSEKQAWEVFGPARLMALRTPEFCEEYGVAVNAKSLTILETGSKFEPIIGKPGDGASPSLSITDEYHEHPDSTQYDTMVTGMGARTQPLALVITTAGDSLESPCYALHEQTQKMLDGSLPNERLFGIIYTIDEGDDWTSELALRKANPNYGVSVSADFLRQQQLEAINDSRKQNVFKTKHLDIWCQARSPWMNMEWWHRQKDTSLKPEQFAGQRCAMAFDLANRLDLVSQARLFSRVINGQKHYYYFGRHYIPQAAVDEPEKTHYQGWVTDGYLIATEGNDCDLDKLLADAAADKKTFQIIGAGLDPWNSIGLSGGLAKLTIKAIEIPQTVAEFSEAMKTIEAAVKDGRFHHDGNPCMTWMVGNVSVKPDAKDNVFPRKDARERKIDGPVALFEAMKVLMTGPKQSVYESRGALEVEV
jgi:phage terminase large subunit-like protein